MHRDKTKVSNHEMWQGKFLLIVGLESLLREYSESLYLEIFQIGLDMSLANLIL